MKDIGKITKDMDSVFYKRIKEKFKLVHLKMTVLKDRVNTTKII